MCCLSLVSLCLCVFRSLLWSALVISQERILVSCRRGIAMRHPPEIPRARISDGSTRDRGEVGTVGSRFHATTAKHAWRTMIHIRDCREFTKQLKQSKRSQVSKLVNRVLYRLFCLCATPWVGSALVAKLCVRYGAALLGCGWLRRCVDWVGGDCIRE